MSERRREKKIFSLDPLPSNSLVYFIYFYWLIFNTISFFFFYFYFVFVFSFYYFCSFSFYFVMVIAMSIHLIDMPLDEECMIYQSLLGEFEYSELAIPWYLHTFCVGYSHRMWMGLICSTPRVQSRYVMTFRSRYVIHWFDLKVLSVRILLKEALVLTNRYFVFVFVFLG